MGQALQGCRCVAGFLAPPKQVAKPAAKKAAPKPPVTGYDLDKLAKAVAKHETNDCKAKVGAAVYNNCFGIKYNGKFARYKTKQASYDDFKRIWSTYYKKFPNHALAKKYSGNDRPQTWLSNVTLFYNTL
jgi:hypothetical protein